MRKFAVFLLMIVSLLFFVSCGDEETKIITPYKGVEIKPVESFGNQINQLNSVRLFTKDGDWIYSIKQSSSGEERCIVRFPIEATKEQEVIYTGEYLDQISIFDGWIFFTESLDGNLCKIKTEGGEKKELASNVGDYVLTEKAIYYDASGYWTNKVYSMSIDGSRKQEILGNHHFLLGIDSGWIYYYIDDGEHGENNGGPYRIKLDGTGKEQLIDPELDSQDSFTSDDGKVFFARSYDEEGKAALVKKTIGGDEEILYSFSSGHISGLPINKKDDIIYYGIGKEVYKMNVDGKGEKELVYKGKTPIVCILLYGGDVLVGTSSGDCAYIKRDGTKIKLDGLFSYYN